MYHVNYAVYSPRQPSLGLTITTCLLYCIGGQYAANLPMLYHLVGCYHKVMSIVAQPFGHNYGLSNFFSYSLAHSMPLSMYHSHYGYSPLWIWLKLWPLRLWPLIWSILRPFALAFPKWKLFLSWPFTGHAITLTTSDYCLSAGN
jgi:hypothetical protein